MMQISKDQDRSQNIHGLIEAIPSLVICVDKQHKIIAINNKAAGLFKLPIKKLVENNLYAIAKTSEIAVPNFKSLTAIFEKENPSKKIIEILEYKRKQSTQTIQWHISRSIIDSNATAIFIGNDLTKEKMLENNLAERKKKHKDDYDCLVNMFKKVTGQKPNPNFSLQEYASKIAFHLDNIIALLPGSVYWMNREMVYINCNNYAKDIMGLKSRKEIFGKTDYDFAKKYGWNKKIAESFRTDDQIVMSTKTPILNREEPPFRVADGSKIYQLSNRVPLNDAEGKIVGMLGISIDITKIKETEKALTEAKTKAEAANAAKTEFLANMSHDLRTPLSGILGMAEILEHRVQPENSKFVQDIETSGKRLLSIINEIIDFIQIETGKMPVRKQTFDLKEMINGLAHLMTIQARQQGIDLSITYPDKVPHLLIGDKERVHRILLNLLNNAIKFTHKGYVKINVSYKKKTAKSGEFIITIEDTGIGIPEDKYDVIFERFSRLNPAYQGLYKGAGLGLRIVKQLIEDLHGTVTVKSKVGKGSIFTSVLPFEVDTSKQKVVAKPKLEHMKKCHARVLLVEDEKMCQFVARTFLSEIGCSVDCVETGEAALKVTQENQYDLILMDIGLPDIPGYKVTEQIRQTDNKNQKTPIIALTAHVLKDEQEKCIAYGVNHVIKKPVSQKSLAEVLHNFTTCK